MDKLEATEKGWNWWVKLPGVAKAIVAAALPVVTISLFVAWFALTQGDPELKHDIAELRRLSDENWNRQFRFNDRIGNEIDSLRRENRAAKADITGLKTGIADLTMITAANSNSPLLRELLPYLQGNQHGIDETYRVVLNIQKSLVARRDTLGISVRKIKGK
jgi:hypothetical protein